MPLRIVSDDRSFGICKAPLIGTALILDLLYRLFVDARLDLFTLIVLASEFFCGSICLIHIIL